MRVHCKFFAIFREMTGIKDEWRELPAGTSVEQLWAQYTHHNPRLRGVRSAYAVNQRLAYPDQELKDGDEIGFLPPVSGGAPTTARGAKRPSAKRTRPPKNARITRRRLNMDELIKQVEFPGAGAIVVFSGVVRDNSHGLAVGHLEYEAYPEMAEATLNDIIADIHGRWPEVRAAMAHRIGRIKISESSLIIVVAAPHRSDAYGASRYAIERIKAILPVWKKEFSSDGEYWVEGPTAGDLPAAKADAIVQAAERAARDK